MHGYGVNQAFYRLGARYRAWRDPVPALISDRALRQFGQSPEGFDRREWRRMSRLARLGYAGRIVGSLWAGAVPLGLEPSVLRVGVLGGGQPGADAGGSSHQPVVRHLRSRPD